MSKKKRFGIIGFIVGAIIGGLVLPLLVFSYNWYVVFPEAGPAWGGYEPFCLGALALVPGVVIGGFIGGAIEEIIASRSDATNS